MCMTTSKSPRLRRAPGTTAVILAIASVLLSGCTATRAFRQAEHEEQREHWDLAVLAYEKALSLAPGNDQYRMSLQRARIRAAQAHYERGRLHHTAGQLDMAQVELEQSLALDSTNDSAIQELKKVKSDIDTRAQETSGGTAVEKAKARTRGMRGAPPLLNPSSTKLIDVAFPPDTNIKKIYQSLGAAAGINVIYDPQLKDDKFTLDLRGMTFQKALETAMRQAGHFYKVIDEKTIIIAQDTNQNRKEYEDLVIRTFFLSNGDVKDVSAMVRSILDLRRLGTIPALNAIVIRDTADKVAVAERLIEVNDKAKSEVVVDVELIQINTDKFVDLGTALSSYSTTAFLTGTTPGPGTTGSTTSTLNSLPWQQLKNLSINQFSFTIPSATFTFIKNNSDAEVLAKPQLRISEGEKAQLVIGERVPIPVTTINTQQAIGGTGVIPITSFQYQDVGIKIDMEPRVHHNKEVTLKLTIEVSQIDSYVTNTDGSKQPVIGTRTITSTIRLKDGETNFLAGLIRKDKTRTKSGIPFLSDLPILGPLFSETSTDDKRTDVFLTLAPHIIRSPQITEEDLVPIWVGTENNVSFSGLNVRLESPNAPGSPFDQQPPVRAVPGPAVPRAPLPIIQGGGPNDPFRRTPVPTPLQTPAPNPRPEFAKPLDDAAVSPAATPTPTPVTTPPPSGPPQIGLAVDGGTISPGEKTVVSVSGVSGLGDLGSLELTVEWDPALVEVTGIAPGAFQDAAGGPVRFEAERVAGRARLQINRRETGTYGLPVGDLARFEVRGRAPGTSLFRVSAATALGRSGPTSPVAGTAAVTVR
jgi:general secretion pathway protein D